MRHAAAIVLICAAACATATSVDSSVAVKQLERKWLDAYEARDVEAMQRIVADNFTITFPDGSMQTKEQVVEAIRKQHERGGKGPRFYTEDVVARQHGRDVVVLTGRVLTERTKQDGTTSRDASRYTDTYVLFGNKWRVVSSHLSNAK
jgi:ketosteroid isomerase-like protein